MFLQWFGLWHLVMHISAGADKQTIARAFIKIQKINHPDGGGSQYLSQKVRACALCVSCARRCHTWTFHVENTRSLVIMWSLFTYREVSLTLVWHSCQITEAKEVLSGTSNKSSLFRCVCWTSMTCFFTSACVLSCWARMTSFTRTLYVLRPKVFVVPQK